MIGSARFLLLLALLAAVPAGGTEPATHTPARSYDDPSTWERIEFDKSQDLVALLEEHRFGPSFWAQGERTAPRIYLADIPARWGKFQAQHLTVAEEEGHLLLRAGTDDPGRERESGARACAIGAADRTTTRR